jgi:hypothetical protein
MQNKFLFRTIPNKSVKLFRININKEIRSYKLSSYSLTARLIYTNLKMGFATKSYFMKSKYS